MFRFSLRSCWSLLLFCLLCSCTKTPPLEMDVPTSAALMARGQYLAEGPAACGFCHGAEPFVSAPLSGGRRLYDQYGVVLAPNITPHETGVGERTPKQLFEAIRRGMVPEEAAAVTDLHRGAEWISDDDLYALVAYLGAVEPVDNEVSRRRVSILERTTLGLGKDRSEKVLGFVPPIKTKNKVQYGKYLINNVARCGVCHDAEETFFSSAVPLGGGKRVVLDVGEREAPSIRGLAQNGLGSWTEDEVLRYLSTGRTPYGERVDGNYCPVEFYANSSRQDMEAMVAYLKTLQ